MLIFFNKVLKLLLILGKAQEIGRFLFGMNLTATIGAFSVDKLARRPERFARGTVKPLVFRLVNIALVIKLFKNLLDNLFVVGVGCTNKFIVSCVEQIANFADFARYLVNIFLRCYAGSSCVFFNFLTVLVGTSHKENVVTLHTLISCDSVGHNDFV